MSNEDVNSTPVLVADIGGTNARFACFDLASDRWLGQWTGQLGDYPDIHAALEAARQQLPALDAAECACIAIAGPVDGDRIKMSNGSWAFSRTELQRRFDWRQLIVINDFLAAASGIATLSPTQYMAIGKSSPANTRLPSAVIGPGTGLGVAGLFPEASADGGIRWTAMATEGGHARFAPLDDEQIAVLQVLYRKLGSVQREDILSGRGLCNLYEALGEVRGLNLREQMAPADVTARALADSNSHAARVLSCFCSILGSVAADVALELGTRGTVYFAGGILPRIPDYLVASPLRASFENHRQFGHYLKDVDTVLVTEQKLGLIGAAYHLQNHRFR